MGVNARLTKANVRCSDEVAVKREALRAPVEELIPLAVDELIESQMFPMEKMNDLKNRRGKKIHQ